MSVYEYECTRAAVRVGSCRARPLARVVYTTPLDCSSDSKFIITPRLFERENITRCTTHIHGSDGGVADGQGWYSRTERSSYAVGMNCACSRCGWRAPGREILVFGVLLTERESGRPRSGWCCVRFFVFFRHLFPLCYNQVPKGRAVQHHSDREYNLRLG